MFIQFFKQIQYFNILNYIYTDRRARIQRNCRIRLFRYESTMSILL